MRVGIFGGTFNPIHNGHMLAADAFLRQASLERLYVIPDGTPPHKSMEQNDPLARLAMTRAAFSADARFAERVTVSDMEITREGPSFSILTVEALRAAGMTELYLYCGTDMLMSFDRWYRAEDLMRCVTIAYAGREKLTPDVRVRVEEKKKLLKERYGARILDIITEPIEISSSEIRARIARGEDISGLVPPAVCTYIKEHKLYL